MIFCIVTISVLLLLLILFIVLWIVELYKNKDSKKILEKQNQLIKTLNVKLNNAVDRQKNIKVFEKNLKHETGEKSKDEFYVFGIADNFKIMCKPNEKVILNSLYTKVVDDYDFSDQEIIDLTKYIPAFNQLNNKQIINISSKHIIDNLKISIPYSLPDDEIVKTRILFGNYTCKQSI